jgi:hypothetical protein
VVVSLRPRRSSGLRITRSSDDSDRPFQQAEPTRGCEPGSKETSKVKLHEHRRDHGAGSPHRPYPGILVTTSFFDSLMLSTWIRSSSPSDRDQIPGLE